MVGREKRNNCFGASSVLFFFFQSMIGLIWDFGREGERERGLTQFNAIWGLKIEESRNIGRIILGAKGF